LVRQRRARLDVVKFRATTSSVARCCEISCDNPYGPVHTPVLLLIPSFHINSIFARCVSDPLPAAPLGPLCKGETGGIDFARFTVRRRKRACTTTMTPQSPNCRRSDIVPVLFPNSNLRTAKTRPALVVQRDDLNSGPSQVVVCTITSEAFRSSHSSRVSVVLNSPEGRQTALLTDSVVMTDNLATVATLGNRDS
jgi:mRNA interferase MazF